MRKLKNNELNRLQLEDFKMQKKSPIVVILDDIRSAHNVGSIFRTSDAFLIDKIYLCGITPQPPHKEIRKTALGASKSVEWQHLTDIEDCINQVKEEGYSVFCVEQVENSISLDDFITKENEKVALIFGNEVKGVQQKAVDLCQGAIEIEQHGTKHSFNISVSAGIAIWSIFQKMK